MRVPKIIFQLNLYEVTICPAAGQLFEKTKCPAVFLRMSFSGSVRARLNTFFSYILIFFLTKTILTHYSHSLGLYLLHQI